MKLGNKYALEDQECRNLSREITLAKLKDLKALCAFIPVQLREIYTSLQAVTPSPRKLRTGPILKNTPTVSSEDEQDLSDEMFSSDSD
ncbi:hypothetical protein PoB_004990500 [Plakobranchus ocellatus]|uniref:Uncharacterized protein n=1 Tax=Plakobranchus ocellatus TaxID=259542 RepID=A0AAV4BWA8_9GAST|nr:hypothetical protein PoB_004990500 [Plakobranchus ocellatus]